MKTAKTPVNSTQPRPGPNSTSGSDKLLALITGGLIGIAFAQPLGAEELVSHAKYYSSEAYSELVSYAQQLRDEQPGVSSAHESPHDFSPHNFTPIDAETYSALRNFVQQIGGEQSGPIGANEPPHHLAPARDEAYSALRDFVREIGGDESAPEESRQLLLAAAEQPKAANPAKAKAAKPAKPAKPINPDDATYVGSQVCTGCHANQATRFGNTVMGKIFLK